MTRAVTLVTGLSGAGKASILKALEDLGYDAVDNLPLSLLGELVDRAEAPLAVGVDTRTRGFDVRSVLATLAALRPRPDLHVELLFADAAPDVLMRRYSETRRRHPLAPHGRVADGIAAEDALLAPLREAANIVIDTSDLPLPALRSRLEAAFGSGGGMGVAVTSFAYRGGLPRDADLVFDARFLRNPHYDAALRPLTGLDPLVAAYVEADPDFEPFYGRMTGLLRLVLPRFVQEGKKYATIAVGCTGGKHRSVHIAQRLAGDLAQDGWRVDLTHRDIPGGSPATRQAPAAQPVQAQEA